LHKVGIAVIDDDVVVDAEERVTDDRVVGTEPGAGPTTLSDAITATVYCHGSSNATSPLRSGIGYSGPGLKPDGRGSMEVGTLQATAVDEEVPVTSHPVTKELLVVQLEELAPPGMEVHETKRLVTTDLVHEEVDELLDTLPDGVGSEFLGAGVGMPSFPMVMVGKFGIGGINGGG
jgi:hypothetical protein